MMWLVTALYVKKKKEESKRRSIGRLKSFQITQEKKKEDKMIESKENCRDSIKERKI